MYPSHSPRPVFVPVREGVLRGIHRAHDALFPARCISCDALGPPICDRCAQSPRPPRHPFISDPVCIRCGRLQQHTGTLCGGCEQRGGAGIDRARAAGLHEGLLQRGIHLLKYRDRTELAPLLARYLIATFQGERWPVARSAVDLVIPVPLHAQRLADRGYNQAELLAEAFCHGVTLPLDAAAVTRVRQTESQVGKDAEERRANVTDAFVARTVHGKVCLVIDDVCTTGATLNATADALKAAGARLVLGLTLAVPALHETPPENAN